jgi:hypothetical protein
MSAKGAGARLGYGLSTALVVLAMPALASAGTRDQTQPRAEQRQWFSGDVGQTFTAGRTGRLDRVDVVIARGCAPTRDVTVEIRTTSPDGQPASEAIASEVVPAQLVAPESSNVQVRFQAAARVVAGTRYAIVLDGGGSICERPNGDPSSPPFQDPAYRWSGASGDGFGPSKPHESPYARGQGWTVSGQSWYALASWDFTFTTFVLDDPATPPAGEGDPPGTDPGGGEPLPAPDADAPETHGTGPKRKFRRPRASFEFTSDEPNSTLECKLDRGPSEPCSSPFRMRVKRGRHTFAVTAIDAAGNRDPSPAVWRFRRVR